jgi:PAS domain S-box-containing protein
VATPTRPRRTYGASPSPSFRDLPANDGNPGSDPDGGRGDVHALLMAAVAEAARLLDADGAMVYVLDPATNRLRLAHDAGIESPRSRAWVRSIDLPVGVGMFGRAVAERSVVVTGNYLDDEAFDHAEEPDRVVRDIGIQSMVVAPLVAGGDVFGALGTFSSHADAFTPAQIGLVRALADHAAAAIGNVRLIEALDASRRELADRADIERSLREIAARISAATDLPAVLQLGVDEAARLLRADGARIDLIDPRSGLLRWAYASGAVRPDDSVWPDDPDETLEQGVSGQAVVLARPFWTGDYANDRRFPHGHGADTYVAASDVRSVMAAPLNDEAGPFGALTVFTGRPDAWGDGDAPLLEAIADQAAITIRTTRLIDELDRSREALRRRAEAEQALREIAARITILRDPTEILQDVVAHAGRLVKADGVILDLLDPASGDLHWATDDGFGEQFTDEERAKLWISVGVGATGIAVAEDRVILADDDLASQFPPSAESTEFYERTGFHSMIAAPITGESGPLGVIEVYSKRRAAFTPADAGLVGALASQAAIAITNARLIDELDRSRADLARSADADARRADTERALRDITARIAALREPDVILHRVVEEARRLLGSDGAHLTRMSESGTYLVPVVVAGSADVADQDWLMNKKFPIGGGINGLAAERREPVWTNDYLADARIPHDPDDVIVAERLGLCGMAAAPLQAPGGEVIGTLAVSSARPREFSAEELDLLQGLADQAAIAITNSTLLTRLTESEARYRYLVERAPDLVWSIGADARLTFLSDAVVRLTGRQPETLLGQHFGALLHGSSSDVADFDWTTGMQRGSQEVRGRVNLAGADGQPVPAEFIATARLDEAGRFLGANGSVRDMREQVRLENELRESEGRYRFLIENAPDVVFATDAEGRLTFVSDALETMAGWRPEEVVGEPYTKIVDSASAAPDESRWLALREAPTVKQIALQSLKRPDGSLVPVEISAIGIVDEHGEFAGIHGSSRDISERTRLERELRRQAGELAAGEERAHLARELHDSVTQALFSMTLVSRSIEMLLDRDVATARTHLTQLRELQREALAEMRALIFELRPGNLEQDGLTRALRTHTAALQGRIGLPVVVESSLTERLPLGIEEVLYRIAQEALHNVVKHASARQVRVELDRPGSSVRLRVRDDGKGFDQLAVPDGHLGLAGMRARADRIGATFSCRSEPGSGTTIEVTVPAAAIAEAGLPTGPAESSAIRDE